MFDPEKLKNIIVTFMLNFPLNLKDCYEANDEGEPYLVVIDGNTAKLYVKRHYQCANTFNGAELAPFSRIEQDRYGLMSKTEIQMWFDRQTLDSIILEQSEMYSLNQKIFELTIEYLNNFINKYRRVTRHFWIPSVRENDIISYRYIQLDQNGETQTSSVICTQSTQFNGGDQFCLSDEQEFALRNQLANNTDDLQDDLRLSIHNNFEQGHYNFAIIQCAILFENWVYSRLNDKLSKTKLKKIEQKDSSGCMSGIFEICTKGLKDVLGLDFGTTNEFNDFHTNVLRIRDELVHGEILEPVSHDQCHKAIVTTLIALQYLSDHWPN
ncbi:MAG: hypothetical protein ACM3MK_13890 [Chitinophagales bacterium]